MSRTSSRRRRWCGWARLLPAAALSLAACARAAAAGPLEKEMAELARQVMGAVKDRGNAVQVGEFVAKGDVARHGATGGPAIAKSLMEQLEKMGVQTTRSAELIVSGEFRDVTDKASKTTALMIKAHIEDRQGEPIVDLASRGVFDLTTIASLTGITLVAPPKAAPAEREKAVNDALDNIRPPCVEGTRISARAGSPYSIEVLVGPDPGDATPDLQTYRPRAATLDKDGLAFVNIRRGEVYAVKVSNRADHDVAVTLAIDGLSMFAFSENKEYEVVIVPKGQEGLIPGWHITNERSDAFHVSEYARSAAAKLLPSSSSVGTISVSFKAAWPADAEPPADEGAVNERSRDADATARGKPVDPKDTRYNEMTRSVGKLRESLGVHYNRSVEPADLPDSKPK
ncbi:hypothetical protein OJF2_74000 [Aquisphaera giovannonii]|uniref:Uncharacterized protein n=1 Tax=Aquisphaera giovannonii TaxID=406548 RepID=A0A5B9WFW7_9BACT|nr:hypothetical protein [Aquisphaera giovannonii]QEH38790.1 hypothetical protein OJF2_74000 [Aquisphaera giovannonii]